VIIKTKSGWRVISHKKKKNMGDYKTKKEAEKRLRQIKYFGKKK